MRRLRGRTVVPGERVLMPLATSGAIESPRTMLEVSQSGTRRHSESLARLGAGTRHFRVIGVRKPNGPFHSHIVHRETVPVRRFEAPLEGASTLLAWAFFSESSQTGAGST
jgi:hypothetical protein